MSATSIISYNLNGIRAATKKGLLDWLKEEDPDIFLMQETKAQPEQLDESLTQPEGYHAYYYSAEKKGYSGVAIFSKEEPKHVEYGCGLEKYDVEGRVIRADYEGYSVISVYFPSGTRGGDRQIYKEDFLKDFLAYLQELRKSYPKLIISGDYNICHQAIDIHDPVRNKNTSGFLLHEREWVSEMIGKGYVDTFRKFYEEEPDRYSWWSYRAGARGKNKGWRIDYQMVTEVLTEKCVGADILDQVFHSDHCPTKLVMDFG
ncbi:MAG: exodeoxyribonuclease III [Bacteroidota bacterium]